MSVPPDVPAVPLSLRTPPFAHYGVAWSPFHPQVFALASSANYGLIGNGRVHVARISPATGPQPPDLKSGLPPSGLGIYLDKVYNTQDGLYDIAWSEIHENQLVTASGDGSLKLWDITLKDLPIRAWHEHSREVFSVDWSNTNKEILASSSWDGLVKIWTPERPTSTQTLIAHKACVYQALFSPHTPFVLATCSTDGSLRIFDLRQTSSSVNPSIPPAAPNLEQVTRPVMVVPAHATEVLSLDWNKYRPWVLASGSVDKSIKIWDCRSVKLGAPDTGAGAACEINLQGHEYAVRKVQWSPHRADVLSSASYDMTCRVWSTTPNPHLPALRVIQDSHTEFVAGCAWSLYDEGLLASCSWDHSVLIFRPNIGA